MYILRGIPGFVWGGVPRKAHVVYTRNIMEKETPQQSPPEDDPGSPPEARDEVRREIPLVSVPNDRDMIAQEMAELFEEDQVTHQHGSSEPEAD